MYMYIYMYIYIYICIYICIEREKEGNHGEKNYILDTKYLLYTMYLLTILHTYYIHVYI